MKCFDCDTPAQLENHTQFAGTHYWCVKHVPKEDLADCVAVLDPYHVKSNFQEHFETGFQLRPHQVTCRLTYQSPTLNFEVEATSHTHHKAKHKAYKLLQTELFQKIKQEHELEATQPYIDQATQPYMDTNHKKTQYLLDKLQEEAAEVIQAISKIRRFGPHNHHPDRNTTNLEELVNELEDFQAIQLALQELKYFDPQPSLTSTIKKFNQLMGT